RERASLLILVLQPDFNDGVLLGVAAARLDLDLLDRAVIALEGNGPALVVGLDLVLDLQVRIAAAGVNDGHVIDLRIRVDDFELEEAPSAAQDRGDDFLLFDLTVELDFADASPTFVIVPGAQNAGGADDQSDHRENEPSASGHGSSTNEYVFPMEAYLT